MIAQSVEVVGGPLDGRVLTLEPRTRELRVPVLGGRDWLATECEGAEVVRPTVMRVPIVKRGGRLVADWYAATEEQG